MTANAFTLLVFLLIFKTMDYLTWTKYFSPLLPLLLLPLPLLLFLLLLLLLPLHLFLRLPLLFLLPLHPFCFLLFFFFFVVLLFMRTRKHKSVHVWMEQFSVKNMFFSSSFILTSHFKSIFWKILKYQIQIDVQF